MLKCTVGNKMGVSDFKVKKKSLNSLNVESQLE